MSDNVIKFTKTRKARTKAEKEQQAIANRAKFGRTREERAKEAANAKLEAERLEGLRLRRAQTSANKISDDKPPDGETPAEFAKRQLVNLRQNRPKLHRKPGDDDGRDGAGGGPSA